MIYKLEKVRKLNRAYVANDCVQVMIKHKASYLTVIGDDILYNAAEGDKPLINEYLQNSKRFKFPYFNIPTHREKNGKILFNYVNQIYEYNKPYIILKDGIVGEDVVKKTSNGKDALIISKELSPIFLNDREYLSAGELKKRLEKFYHSLKGNKLVFKNGGHLISKNELLYNHSNGKFLIICLNGNDKVIYGISIENHEPRYQLDITEFPIYAYTSDFVRVIEKQALDDLEPKVSKLYNLSIPKEDIISARSMAEMKKSKVKRI